MINPADCRSWPLVGTLLREVLDRGLIWNHAHLRRILSAILISSRQIAGCCVPDVPGSAVCVDSSVSSGRSTVDRLLTMNPHPDAVANWDDAGQVRGGAHCCSPTYLFIEGGPGAAGSAPSTGNAAGTSRSGARRCYRDAFCSST